MNGENGRKAGGKKRRKQEIAKRYYQ